MLIREGIGHYGIMGGREKSAGRRGMDKQKQEVVEAITKLREAIEVAKP